MRLERGGRGSEAAEWPLVAGISFPMLPAPAYAAGADDFVTTWIISTGGSITVPVDDTTGTYNIDRGGGSTASA